MGNQYIVKWGSILQDNYNYGATISFDENGSVTYASPLMPPSLCIKNWYSQREFHISRNTPYLPILTPGNRYHLKVNLDLDQSGAIQLKIIFFNRYDEMVEEYYFSALEEEFVFPKDAVHYEVQLINKHHQKLVFHTLVITEKHLTSTHETPTNLLNTVLHYKYKPELADELKLVILPRKSQVQHLRLVSHTDYIFCIIDPLKKLNLIEIVASIYSLVLKKNLRKINLELVKETNYYKLPENAYRIIRVLNLLLHQKLDRLNDETNFLEKSKMSLSDLQISIQVLQHFLTHQHK